jgi:hypothetical protein
MISGVKKGIDLRHAHAFGTFRDLFDPVSRADLAFLDDSEIKARPPVRDHQRRHFRVIETQTEPVASDARLADFEDGAADPVTVADKDLCVGQSIDREILAEIAMNEVRPAKMIGPVTVGIELVDHEGALLAAVAARSACPSPTRLSRPAKTRPSTGCFQIAVRTGFPRHATSRGKPTLTETTTFIWNRPRCRCGPLQSRCNLTGATSSTPEPDLPWCAHHRPRS